MWLSCGQDGRYDCQQIVSIARCSGEASLHLTGKQSTCNLKLFLSTDLMPGVLLGREIMLAFTVKIYFASL